MDPYSSDGHDGIVREDGMKDGHPFFFILHTSENEAIYDIWPFSSILCISILLFPVKKTVRPKVVSQIWTENSDDYNCSPFPKDDVNK